MVLSVFSLGKLICYECFTDVSNLRKHLGKRVIYQIDRHQQIDGILLGCKYQFNDKFGFFDIRINITGTLKTALPKETFYNNSQISISIDVFDVKKIIKYH